MILLIFHITNSLGLHKGVIYAFSQYSPFVSIPAPATANLSHVVGENYNSNLGPEDVAEVRQMTSAAAAASLHEYTPRLNCGNALCGLFIFKYIELFCVFYALLLLTII